MADDAEVPDPPPSPPRIGYCLIQAATLSILTGLFLVAAKYEVIFVQLGMSRLPPPTELLLLLARCWRQNAGVLVVPAVGLILIGLALSGRLDRYLRKLIVLNIVCIVLLIPFGFLSLHMPIAQIEKALQEK